MIRSAIGALALAVLTSVAPSVSAHDASAYGGLFRSRNLGLTWLNADVGLFLNAVLTVAIDPRDPNHLLMGTDIGLLGSTDGGRSWRAEAQDVISGPAFAVAFSPDGQSAICAAPGGVLRFHDGQWSRAAAPSGAVPAREIVFGSVPGRVYLLGDGGLFTSDDGGRIFRRVEDGLTDDVRTTALAVAMRPREVLFAVIDGKLMASEDRGQHWRRRVVGPGGASVDIGVLDPSSPSRVWAAAADLIYVSDDLGLSWRAVGKPLPERETSVRGIAADPTISELVVTTHRGMYRSETGGSTWTLKEGNLPIHLEAGPLVRDASDAQTLYAVYSLMPYAEVWRTALQGGSVLSRVDALSLAGGLAFVLLLMLCGILVVRWLDHRRSARFSLP